MLLLSAFINISIHEVTGRLEYLNLKTENFSYELKFSVGQTEHILINASWFLNSFMFSIA